MALPTHLVTLMTNASMLVSALFSSCGLRGITFAVYAISLYMYRGHLGPSIAIQINHLKILHYLINSPVGPIIQCFDAFTQPWNYTRNSSYSFNVTFPSSNGVTAGTNSAGYSFCLSIPITGALTVRGVSYVLSGTCWRVCGMDI